MKKIVIILTLLSTIMNGSAQQDTTLSHSLDYSTKGIYVSATYFISGMKFVPEDSTEDWHFYEGINSSLQIELKRNVAINLWYGFSPKFNYQDTWFNNKITTIGSNINFPLYKYYKHHGFYMAGGISWKKNTGYYSSSGNALAQAKFQEYSSFNISTWAAETGIGFEYKIRYLQFYSFFKFKIEDSNEYGQPTGSLEYTIGARFKISKLFKNPKQRYQWF